MIAEERDSDFPISLFADPGPGVSGKLLRQMRAVSTGGSEQVMELMGETATTLELLFLCFANISVQTSAQTLAKVLY